jgi:hypothetical protein
LPSSNRLWYDGAAASEGSGGREHFAEKNDAFPLGHFTDDAVAEGPFEVHNYGEWVPNQMEDVSQPAFVQSVMRLL